MRSSSSTSEVSRIWLLAVVAAAAGIVIYALGALQPLQDAAIDEEFSLAGVHTPPSGIVIVALDDSSLRRINAQFPIPRSYYAHLLDALHQGNPRLIALDLQFNGVSREPGQDHALLSAFGRDGPVLAEVTDTGTGVPAIAGVSHPRGVVAASGAVDTDSDGVLRQLMYVQVNLQTFAIRAAELAQGRMIPAARVPGNHAWIDYAGPAGTYRTYPMADVLDGAVPSSAFTGKIVLVGVTAPIEKDVFTTSASSRPMSGVEVQANSIETALRGFPLRSSYPALSLALILVLALAPVALSWRAGSLLVGLAATVLALLFLGAARLAFAYGLILPVPDPIVSLGVATAGVVGVENVIERRKRRSLETVLDDFLRPGDRAFFLSYRRDQNTFVARSLRSALEARFGDRSVFMDEAAINPGQEWPREIQEAILGCRALLVLIGPHWLMAQDADSGGRRLDNPEDWVLQEVEAGLARSEAAVIPVLVDGAIMPAPSDLPPSIRSLCDRKAFNLEGLDLDREVEALADGIRRGHLGPLWRAGARPPADP